MNYHYKTVSRDKDLISRKCSTTKGKEDLDVSKHPVYHKKTHPLLDRVSLDMKLPLSGTIQHAPITSVIAGSLTY